MTQELSSPAGAGAEARGGRLSRYLVDPLGSVISASVAVIGSFGTVLAGIWLIQASLG